MRERRTSAIRYLAAVVVLVAGLTVLAFGARAAVAQVALESASARVTMEHRAVLDAAAVAADASPAVPRPVVTSASASASATATPTPPPTPTASASPHPSPTAGPVPSTVGFEIVAAPAGTKCWGRDCLLWTVTADAGCSRASATLDVPTTAEGDAAPLVHEVGGFVSDRDRVVELDGVPGIGTDGIDAEHLTPRITCLAVGDGF